MSDSKAANGGIGLTGAVFLVFLTLKLTGNIDWSWYAVTAPLWAPVALVLAVALVIVPFCLPGEIRGRLRVRKERAAQKAATAASFTKATTEASGDSQKLAYQENQALRFVKGGKP